MDNIVMFEKSGKASELSKKLGFDRTFFSSDFVLIKSKTKKDLLKKIKESKSKLTIFEPISEELLRFALEKTSIDMVINVEKLHFKDHTHYVRSGLDQILCKIASSRGKIIGFSFSSVLNSKGQARLISRMKFNLKLCKKYKVKMFISNFSLHENEMRSASDLKAFFGNNSLSLTKFK